MLTGKRGIVTGAAGGIGAATAWSWAKNGAKVVCADIDFKGVQNLVDEINKQYKNCAVAVKMDVTSKADTIKALDLCVKSFGGIEMYFANAGILPPLMAIEDQSEEDFMKAIDVNLFSAFLGIKYASIYMKKHNPEPRKCSIVCTGSVAAIRANLTTLSYPASKGGVLSMIQTANDQFLVEGIRVNSIVPGGVNTSMFWNTGKDLHANGLEIRNYDFERFPPTEPEELANVVTFLMSDLSTAIKGQVIVADGGMSRSMGSQPYPTKKQSKL